MDHASPLTEEQRQAVEEFRRRHRTGVLALLFTDVERSTALRGEMGEMPASALLERHGVAIREVLGRFPEAQLISTAGDSFFMVFAKPSDAVRFALLVQLRLRTLAAQNRPGFRVNIGTHLGEVVVEERAETGKVFDVLGMQVDIAARVTALASSGQILMTRGMFDNARQILKGQLLPGVGELSWMSHGPYLLKGFDEPLAICEVGEIGIAPLRSPADCDVGKRAAVPGTELVLGWRPAVEQVVPGTEWVLTEKIGEGGFGEVWHASHRRTREQRVFKFCFRADRLRSLKHEMTLFRVLKEVLGERSDIARLYNVQFEEAPYYLEVEYTAGGNLAEWLKKQEVRGRRPEARETQDSALGTQDSALSTQDATLGTQDATCAVPLSLRLEIVAQIASALAAAHSVGIIHRDVKPSNILIEERKDGSIQVRLTDFGIGQLTDREVLARAGITTTGFTQTVGALTEFSSYTGTRLYMAPELTAGRPPSIQSDIYSLGVLLYQLAIGDLSEPMTTDWERGVRDPLLREDLHHCLAGEPAERFSSADELAQRLRALPQRRRQWRTKRLLKATALACAVALAAGLLGWLGVALYHRYKQAEQAAVPPTPEDLIQRCAGNLQKIHAGLVRYRQTHNGDMPSTLSEQLVPAYVEASALRCGNNPPETKLLPEDPNSSYSYEFSSGPVPPILQGFKLARGAKSIREWKERQRKEFGDHRVPTVRCFHHGDDQVLNLSYSGRLYFSGQSWENDPGMDYEAWVNTLRTKK